MSRQRGESGPARGIFARAKRLVSWNPSLICGVAAVAEDTRLCTVTGTIAVVEVEMAQRVTVALEDDLDGGPADETVRFAFGGADYEIDLSKKNAAAFRKQLAPF